MARFKDFFAHQFPPREYDPYLLGSRMSENPLPSFSNPILSQPPHPHLVIHNPTQRLLPFFYDISTSTIAPSPTNPTTIEFYDSTQPSTRYTSLTETEKAYLRSFELDLCKYLYEHLIPHQGISMLKSAGDSGGLVIMIRVMPGTVRDWEELRKGIVREVMMESFPYGSDSSQ